jgi:hypothetical protein
VSPLAIFDSQTIDFYVNVNVLQPMKTETGHPVGGPGGLFHDAGTDAPAFNSPDDQE